MASSWPPTPSVEDEEAALAREHGLTSVISPLQSDEEPQVKGTVDQYPIILDVHPSKTLPIGVSTTESDREHLSSDESHGPPTPMVANSEQRFVLLDHGSQPKASPKADWQLPRPKSTANLKSDDLSRGRPYVSPIRTDVSDDLDEMVTGRRPPPSPYSSGANKPSSDSQLPKHFSGSSHLSPQHASEEYQRPRPNGARAKHEDARSLADPEKPSEQCRQDSRRRRDGGIRTERPSLEKVAPSTFEKHSLSYTAALPAVSILASGLNRQAREEPSVTDFARGKRASRDSPYSSATEEKARRHRSKSRRRSKSRPRIDRTNVRESPYTSSAEESGSNAYRRYKEPATTRKLSRRNSTIEKERPHLDISDQHYSYGAGDLAKDGPDRSSKRRSDLRHHPVSDGRSHLEPSSAQSPQVMEDSLAKAFNANSERSSRTLRASPNPSPLTSPPRSPPRTPRRDRSSKDYFDLELSGVQDGPRSRQPSGDDSPWNILRPLTNTTAAAVAGAAASRTIPCLSRSSTAPIDTPSHSSSSHSASSRAPSIGQCSRRPSPVQEDTVRPVSRANSFNARDDRPLSRVLTSAFIGPRRQPRVPTIITDASSGIEHRPISRAGHAGLEAPRPVARAYSTTPDETHRPPPAYRVMSSSQALPSPMVEQWRPVPGQRTASSTYVTPASATSPSVFPFLPPRSMSFTPVPVQGLPAPTTKRELAPKNLPPCPRSTPVAGFHDWGTVKQVSDINICPTCMGTLGASRFRDIFVPSFSNSCKEILCSMNQPWLRIAFIQAIKQRRTPQEMTKLLYDLIHLPDGTRPCSGKNPETRKWYQLVDPFDRSIVPGFEVCTHCVRNVDLVFPQLKGTFTRTTSLLQERVCNLNAQCKRFLGYIEHLDKAASRFDAERSLQRPDVQDLARYARRVANIQDCPRDNMMLSQTWHFMSTLPEFTVCPECFEEVVRPVWDKSLANSMPKKPRLLPCRRRADMFQLVQRAASCTVYG